MLEDSDPKVDLDGGTKSGVQPSGDPLWRAATGLTETIARLVEKDVRERTTVRNHWAKVLKAMQEGRVDIAARLLNDPLVPISTEFYPQTAAQLKNVRLAVLRAAEASSTRVLQAVAEMASSRGWRSHADADRVVVDGLLHVTLSAKGVKVQSRPVRSFDVDEVLKALEAEYARIWTRAHEGVSDFARDLAATISEARSGSDLQGYTRLQDVYNRLKSARPKSANRLASYYRDEFSADLSCLTQDPAWRQRFEFSAARDPQLAFPVVLDDGTLNQYGYVRMREGGPNAHAT